MGRRPVKNPAFEREHPRNHGQFAKKYGRMLPSTGKRINVYGMIGLYDQNYDSPREALDAVFSPDNRYELQQGVELRKDDDGTYYCRPNPGFDAQDATVDLYMDADDRYDPGDALFETTPTSPDDFKVAHVDDDSVHDNGMNLEPVQAFLNGRTQNVTVRTMPVTPWRSRTGDKVESEPSDEHDKVVVCAWDGTPLRLADRQLHNIEFMTDRMKQMGAIPKGWDVYYDTTVKDEDGTTILRPMVKTPDGHPNQEQWRQVSDLIGQVTQGLTSATSRERGEGIFADEPRLMANDPWA